MPKSLSTSAIVLRRISYGDDDLILSLITPDGGKQSAIAKSAKKSRKRFAGILEPFTILDVVLTFGRGRKGLPILKEAVLSRPFQTIGPDVLKAAYASYWVELIDSWLEDANTDKETYCLLGEALDYLDTDRMPAVDLSVLFQIRFISAAGYAPNLVSCGSCGKALDDIVPNRAAFSIRKGSLICDACNPRFPKSTLLSKGTIKQLLWMASGDMAKASKIRLTPAAREESIGLLERFIPYHLGKEPKSLAFLRSIRKDTQKE